MTLIGSLLDDGNAGFNFENSCVAATTANLTATYSNGASGVGATLTNSGALAAFSVDGQTPSVGARILVKDQSTQTQNGIYVVTVAGSGSVAWVLTRADDYDTPSQINSGDIVPVSSGTQNAGSLWRQTATVTTVGSSNITFAGFFLPSNYVLKAGDTMTGNLSAPKIAIGTTDYPAINTIGEGLTTGVSLDGVTQTTRTSRSRIGNAELNFIVNHLHSASNWIKTLFALSNSDTNTHVSVTNGQVISGNYYAGRYQSGGTGSYYLAASDEVGIDDTGTISATSMPGKRTRSVTPNGSKTPVIFETVSNNGNVAFSKNIFAPNVGTGITATTASGGTLTLDINSTYQQVISGSSAHTVVLPVVSTIPSGQYLSYLIKYFATGTNSVTINSSGGNLVASISRGGFAIVTFNGTAGTNSTSWTVIQLGTSATNTGGSLVTRDISGDATLRILTLTSGIKTASNVESLSANKTLAESSPQYQFLNPNGSNRDVTLPAGITGMQFIIKNTGSAGEVLTVKNSGGTAIIGGTIANTVVMGFFYDGSAWQLI